MRTRPHEAAKPNRAAVIAVAVGVVYAVAGCAGSSGGVTAPTHVPLAGGVTAHDPHTASLSSEATRHYEYVFPNGAMYVYDIGHGHRLIQRVLLPGVTGVRGVAASPRTHMLYISFGAFGGPGTVGRPRQRYDATARTRVPRTAPQPAVGGFRPLEWGAEFIGTGQP